MYVIMGATGHVGSATARALLAPGHAVIVMTRNASHATEWHARGAQIVEAHAENVESLRAAFQLGRRAFILNPPAAPSTDTDVVERGTVANILSALDGSGLEKIVVQSTAGAQPGERIGDLSVLWELEEGLHDLPIPAAINRGAYYMSNWDSLLDTVRDTGKLPTLFPADLAFPMVAPRDLGEVAAARMLSSIDDVGVRHVQGPRLYSPNDVAQAFSKALGRPVEVQVIPRDQWESTFQHLGFSPAAAQSYARMSAVSLDSGFDVGDDAALHGTTTLEVYIEALVQRSGLGALG
ncbi:NmrA family NAD(P)-binding protein [Pseudomonas sp. T1.Ur]|uniref:NmrA family NAD(P)-binding protein n=1 Tax=Pseudomonas sp. T1.Ur TaxID=2928704 RepID=UPI00201DAC75|nr:NmrA family NAD(P)-binding protein [Pseudomonas sp. T1.Ur]MCL6701429.1 NmrA family NAD(P)-binding protein [Pseudomonas sp. T1.Ur]